MQVLFLLSCRDCDFAGSVFYLGVEGIRLRIKKEKKERKEAKERKENIYISNYIFIFTWVIIGLTQP
jgi:hypothetical protein